MEDTATLEIKVSKIFKVAGEITAVRGYVDITINDVILIKGIRIIDGKNGLFISMPSEKAKDNQWYETVRCLNKDIKEQIRDTVLEAYHSNGE